MRIRSRIVLISVRAVKASIGDRMRDLDSFLRAFVPVLSLVHLASAVASAAGAPPGIYTLSTVNTFGSPDELYTGLSGDGSIVRTQFANRIWTYPAGKGAFFAPGSVQLSQIQDASPDMEFLLGGTSTFGPVVMRRDGSEQWLLGSSSPSGVFPSWVSPNGRFVAGDPSILSGAGFSPNVGRWSAEGGFEVLDRGAEFMAANAVAVTNDGTVYGHVYSRSPSAGPGDPPAVAAVRDHAVRWNPDGSLEHLVGTDESGIPWQQLQIDQISSNGSTRLGWGRREVARSDGGVDRFQFVAVFDESGIDWTLWDQRVENIYDAPRAMGMSADGSLVFSNGERFVVDPFPGYVDVPLIWTRDGGRVDFDVFLRSMGLDTSNWSIGAIRDVSDDGRSFLVQGSALGGNGYQLLIVIPEPAGALLLGLGLFGLSILRAVRATSIRGS